MVEINDYEVKREVVKEIELEEGGYILVPMTTGAKLQKTSKLKLPKISYVRDNIKGYSGNVVPFIHPQWRSTLRDVFNKMDINRNHLLSLEELKFFGAISGLKYFQTIKKEEFADGKGKLRKYGSTKDGLTATGFVDLLTNPEEIKADDLTTAIKGMGYDKEDHFSFKSRAITVSILSTEKIDVKMGDALSTNFVHKVADMMNDYQLKENGEGDETIDEDNYMLFVNSHPISNGTSFSIINKSDSALQVDLDLTGAKSTQLFTPSSGKVSCKVKPKSMKYLATSIPIEVDGDAIDIDDVEHEVEEASDMEESDDEGSEGSEEDSD